MPTSISKWEAWRDDDTGYWCLVEVTYSFFNGATSYKILREKMTRMEAEGWAANTGK